MTYENYIKAKLVQLVVREAYVYGGYNVMCAVGQVIANRVNAGWGDWMRVIEHAPDYTGTIVETPKIDPRDVTFRRMLSMVDDIYHMTADDTNVNVTDDRGKKVALYYADLTNLNRPWFQEKILDDREAHPRIATVGPLSFFA